MPVTHQREPLARLLELCKVLEAALKRYTAPALEAVSHVQREISRAVLEAVIRETRAPARVTPLPFYRRARSGGRPAAGGAA